MNAIIQQINSIGNSFVNFALAMLVQSTVLILILIIVDFFIKNKVRAVFRYGIWMLVLIKLIIPPSVSSPLSLAQILPEKVLKFDLSETAYKPIDRNVQHEDAVQNKLESTEWRRNFTETNVTPVKPQISFPPDETRTITWQAAVFITWLAVVAAMILLLLQRITFVFGLVRQAKKVNSRMNDTLSYCRKLLNIKSGVKLKVSPNATSPAVCGLLRPVILVPENLAPSLGASHLRAVLLHELAHIKRGDLWVNLVQTLLQIVYFYNPFVWLANALIRRVREQAVDETVQVTMGERAEQYPQTLVDVAKLAFKKPALSLRLIGVVESKSALKGRIERMLNRPIPKSAKLGFAGLLAVLVFGVILLPMARAKNSVQRSVDSGQIAKKSGIANSSPVVVKTIPAVFADDVSPKLKTIKVTFDQPMMDHSWSWVGGGDTYPKTTGKPRYNNSRTTCRLPVNLEPDKVYWIGINSPRYKNFKTDKRVPAVPYVILFATKGRDGKHTTIPEHMLAKAKTINELAKNSSEIKSSDSARTPYTQEMFNDIEADCTILFETPIKQINQSGRPITTTGFINSDFVHVTSMSDAKGRPIKFTSTHEGDIYRYKLTFNEPVLPGEMMQYTTKGTITGLVNPVPGSEDTFQYSMTHWPQVGRPTLRIETYLLPEGAELLSTAPEEMQRRTKDGRIELHIEEIIPPGGSITTAFQYQLTGKSEDEKSGQQLQVINNEELNLSIVIPADWDCYKNPAPGRYKFSWQLLPSKLKAWAMFIGDEFPQEGVPADTTVRQIAVSDVAILKSFFDAYTVRPDSWTEFSIAEIPAVSYIADYEDEAKAMVEYRTYLLGESMVYWFVFRIEKDKFEAARSEFDSIVNSFKLNRVIKNEPVMKEEEWTTIAEFTFDEERNENIDIVETDPGLAWSTIDGIGRFAGTTEDTEWIGNRLFFPVAGDTRAVIELSGDFKIAHSDGYQLVGLWGLTEAGKPGWAGGPLNMFFEGKKGMGHYRIQTRWLTLPSELVQGSERKFGFGDEKKIFHKMRMVLDREASEISYHIDDVPLGTVHVDGEIGPITKIMMDIETPFKRTELDIRYDNVRARSSGEPYQFKKTHAQAPNVSLLPKEAIDSAYVWLKLVDDGDYDKSWEQAAGCFKSVVSKDQWQRSVESIRRPLGKMISRKVKSKRYTRELPGAPDGKYVVIEFNTSFENKKEAIETITPVLDKDGTWRVSGHYIK